MRDNQIVSVKLFIYFSFRIQHTMHGVSHALPDDDNDIEPPPPVHYGIDQALKNGSVALNARRQSSAQQQQEQQHVKNFFSNEDLRNVGRSGKALGLFNPKITRPDKFIQIDIL
jgi:hypothetical protein